MLIALGPPVYLYSDGGNYAGENFNSFVSLNIKIGLFSAMLDFFKELILTVLELVTCFRSQFLKLA